MIEFYLLNTMEDMDFDGVITKVVLKLEDCPRSCIERNRAAWLRRMHTV